MRFWYLLGCSVSKSPQLKECNRTDLIAYANYEYERLCFIVVPLRGKLNLGPRPHWARSWYLLGVTFKKCDEQPLHSYTGVPPPPLPRGWDQGSEGRDSGSGIRDMGSGIRDQGSGTWDRVRGSFLKNQGSGCTIFVGSETKVCHAFKIKDQKFGYRNGVSDEKTYLVTTLL